METNKNFTRSLTQNFGQFYVANHLQNRGTFSSFPVNSAKKQLPGGFSITGSHYIRYGTSRKASSGRKAAIDALKTVEARFEINLCKSRTSSKTSNPVVDNPNLR